MLYLYALAEHPTALPATTGIGEARLAAERLDGLAAVVSVHDSAVIDQSEETILAHARVVDALVTVNDAVLPARFGRGFADLESLQRAIDPRATELRRALDQVRGCVELGLRVLAPAREETADEAASGREYLMARLEARRRAEQVASELHGPLAAVARAATSGVLSTPQLLLSAAYLVPRGEVELFRDVVRELERNHPTLTFACTGPWPPYSFATAEGGSA